MKEYHQRKSNAWYLLPIFFSIIGGIIAYAFLRDSDPRRARISLLLGFVLLAVFVAFVVLVVIFSDDSNTNQTVMDTLPDIDKESVPIVDQSTAHTSSPSEMPDMDKESNPVVDSQDDQNVPDVIYEQYSQECLNLEDENPDLMSCIQEHGTDISKCFEPEVIEELQSCVKQESQSVQECRILEDKYPDLMSCIEEHGSDSLKCFEPEVIEELQSCAEQESEISEECLAKIPIFTEFQPCAEQEIEISQKCLARIPIFEKLQSCAEQESEISQKCQIAVYEEFLPYKQEVQRCVAQYGINEPLCREKFVSSFEEAQSMLFCMEQHGFINEKTHAISKIFEAFEAYDTAVRGLFPTYDDGDRNQWALTYSFKNCGWLSSLAAGYASDLYAALDPDVDYTELSDEEFLDILANRTLVRYGFPTVLYDQAREHVEAYQNLIIALDDFLVIKGCFANQE